MTTDDGCKLALYGVDLAQQIVHIKAYSAL